MCIRYGLELDLGFTIGDKGRENKSGWEGGAFTIGDRSGKDVGVNSVCVKLPTLCVKLVM